MIVRRRDPLGMADAAVGAGKPALGAAEAAPQHDWEHDGIPGRTLKVMQFNIWLGGSQVPGGRAGIADTVAAVEPDLVMLSESNRERVANLRADLAERGLTYFGIENSTGTLMIGRAADVAAAATVALPAGVRVREVTDRKDFDRVRQLAEAARDVPWHWLPSALEHWGVDEIDPCTVLVAESADGRVVATGWVRFHTGTDFASTWGSATLPSWRGRGLHRTLVGRHARLAVDRGHRYLYSETLPTSRPTAVRLGFTTVRTLTPYHFTPGG
ncbi:GNAT family N-acetyltransferase [Actinosynnema sp. NPDC049800]